MDKTITRLKPHSQARYLLCSDLDRTLIPNGPQAESPGARERLRALVEHHAICVVYVTGRNRALVEQAVAQFDLPWPDAVIGDVGTRIWSTFDQRWTTWSQWDELIRRNWTEQVRERAGAHAESVGALQRQPEECQTAYKLSYFCPARALAETAARLKSAFAADALPAAIIASLDETTDQGLIDILPDKATKRGAIEMVMGAWGFAHWATVCAGDSGNDLPFLTSALQAVLVANATESVREQALSMAQAQGQIDNLYLARGGPGGMNGNYAAGVIEGFAHYVPEARDWLE
ncbi:HAD-IIB family hydrolase [Wenzhouxiangella limi]|uniref:HAD-IIB family hydrolase n=1 Tax=Wenzhouxiangella limi TaxID=2707351 RepID=UPI0030B7F60B